jgi:cold shock protein
MKTLILIFCLFLFSFAAPRETGTVKSFDAQKGFGYIIPDSENSAIFVHVTGLAVSIKAGDRVEFETEIGPRGPYAINVKKINGICQKK